jgi:hypothetical protein
LWAVQRFKLICSIGYFLFVLYVFEVDFHGEFPVSDSLFLHVVQ